MRRVFTIILIIISVALGGWGGYVFAVSPLMSSLALVWRIVIYVAGVGVAWCLSIMLHEFGHAFFGFFCCFFVRINKPRLFQPAASCGVSPFGGGHMRLRMFFLTIGGLVFNFVLLVLSVLGMVFNEIVYFVPFLPVSVYLFVLNAIPSDFALGKNDGLMCWELLKNKPSSQVLCAVLTAQGIINEGTAMKDLDENILLNVPVIREDDYAFFLLTSMRVEYYEAVGDTEKVAFYINRLQELKEYFPDKADYIDKLVQKNKAESKDGEECKEETAQKDAPQQEETKQNVEVAEQKETEQNQE
jgi:hypothetical protein